MFEISTFLETLKTLISIKINITDDINKKYNCIFLTQQLKFKNKQ